MTVTHDAKALSAIGVQWYSLSHSRTVTGFEATGDNLWVVVTVLVRRNERVDPQLTALVGETFLKSEGRIWLNNLPPGERTHAFLEMFSGRVSAGEFDVTVTPSSGTRFSGEYRFDVRTFSDVARAGRFTTVFGDDRSDTLQARFASVSGRRAVVAFAHESTTQITDFTADNVNRLDLFLATGEGIVGDVAGAASVTVTAERSYGKRFCGAVLDLVEHVDATSARITVTGATPVGEIVEPPVESPVTIPVLTLAPAVNQINPEHFRGELFRFPYQPIKVPYVHYPVAGLANSFAQGGVDKLDEFLHRYAGTRILVVGHSMGGQVIYKWLRQEAETSDISPYEVTFICTGNLERKYNGLPAGGDYPGPPDGSGLPDGAWGYKVIDIARQYDFWADHPNDTDNAVAMRNIDPTDSGLGWGSPVHVDYSKVSPNPDDPRNFSITEDTVTYVWSPTYPVPLIDDEDFFDTTTTLEPRDDVLRAEVEAAYTRPVTIPDPPPSGVLDERFPWAWDGSVWVRTNRAAVETTDWWLSEEEGS